MKTLVAAAVADDAKMAWPLLSKPSQRREGSLAAFRKDTWPTLRRELAPFAEGALPVQISENIDDRFGLITLSRGKHAFATAMRRTGPTWLMEIPGPLQLDVLGPPPGSRGKFVKQIGVESHGHQGNGIAILYLDGVTLDPQVYEGPKSATIYANFESTLVPGLHTATAFATAGDNAIARAWTFRP